MDKIQGIKKKMGRPPAALQKHWFIIWIFSAGWAEQIKIKCTVYDAEVLHGQAQYMVTLNKTHLKAFENWTRQNHHTLQETEELYWNRYVTRVFKNASAHPVG